MLIGQRHPKDQSAAVRAPSYFATAGAVGAVLIASRLIPAARSGYPSDLPPLLLQWRPAAGIGLLLPLGLGVAMMVALPVLSRRRGPALLAVLVAFVWLFSTTLAMQEGKVDTFAGCCARGGGVAELTFPLTRPTDYYPNVRRIDEWGLRYFVSNYPWLARPALHRLTLHATTHPPGAVVVLWAAATVTGHRVLLVALVVVLVGALGVIPTYLLAEEAYGADVATGAALLFATAPGVVLYSATSVDVVFMTAFACALALSVRAHRATGWAVAGGAVATLAATFTWGALALAPLTFAFLLVKRVSGRRLAARAVAWAAGALSTAVVLRLLLGMDLVPIYRANLHAQFAYRAVHVRPYWYWAAGNLLGFLITGGVLCVALFLVTLRSSWRERRLGFEWVLLGVLVVLSLSSAYRGETDHNWLIFLPVFLAAAAGSRVPPRTAAVGGLAQSVATQVLFFTNW